ncbi:MAG: hypothetical protein FVQ81_00965 [Candidatus Glassbacteria bacterium]|nr:hypothetical protein [Candidatus Glassbacteria bacterium]
MNGNETSCGSDFAESDPESGALVNQPEAADLSSSVSYKLYLHESEPEFIATHVMQLVLTGYAGKLHHQPAVDW